MSDLSCGRQIELSTRLICNNLFRLEQGDYKLRVRALEVERQLERSKLVQKNTFSAVVAGLLLQSGCSVAMAGTGLGAVAVPLTRVLFGAAVIAGLRVPYGLYQLRNLDKYNERFGVKK